MIENFKKDIKQKYSLSSPKSAPQIISLPLAPLPTLRVFLMEFYSQPEIIYPSTEVNNVSTGENQNSELEETSTDNTGTNRVLPVRSNNPYYTSYLTHKKVTQNKQVSTSPKQRPRKVVKRVRVRGKLKKLFLGPRSYLVTCGQKLTFLQFKAIIENRSSKQLKSSNSTYLSDLINSSTF